MNQQGLLKGYNAGVVDPHKNCDAPHDAGPLPLELVWLSQVAIQAGIQEANNSCGKGNKQTRIKQDKQKSSENASRQNLATELRCGIISFVDHALLKLVIHLDTFIHL